jgi:STE24 endopeptidase
MGYTNHLISGLVKLFTKNSGNLNPDKLYSELNFSHPPLVERIAALEGASKKND